MRYLSLFGFCLGIIFFVEAKQSGLADLELLSMEALQQKIEFYKYHNNDTALIYAQELLKRNEDISEIDQKVINVGLITRVYIHLEYYDLALKLYQEIMPDIKKVNDPVLIAESYQYIANLYSFMRDYNTAIPLFKQSILYRAETDVEGIVHSLHGLGDDYRFMNKYDSSYLFIQKGFQFSKQIKDKELKGQVALSYAESLLKLDSVSSAKSVLRYVKDSLRYGHDSDLGKGYVLGVEGIIKAKEGKYKEAVQDLVQVLEIAKSIHYHYGVISVYGWLMPVLEEAKMFELAYQHSKDYKEYEMASFKNGQEKLVKQLEIIHETKQKEQALQFQAQELSRNKVVIIILVGLFVLSVVLIIVTYRNSIQKHKMALRLKDRNDKIELLMRELHHRVKNNLQVISSLLGLQSMKMEEGKTRRAVEEGKSRVRAMAMIHQRLYRKEDLIGVDFNDYVMELVSELKNTYCPHDSIALDIRIPSKSMDIDTTLPLGLIINEMVSNSFKYAFADIDKPMLKVELLEENEKIKLMVSDNGLGLNKEFDLQLATSFGIKLIKMLARQLNATLEIKNSNGLHYELQFAISK